MFLDVRPIQGSPFISGGLLGRRLEVFPATCWSLELRLGHTTCGSRLPLQLVHLYLRLSLPLLQLVGVENDLHGGWAYYEMYTRVRIFEAKGLCDYNNEGQRKRWHRSLKKALLNKCAGNAGMLRRKNRQIHLPSLRLWRPTQSSGPVSVMKLTVILQVSQISAPLT